MNETDRLKAEAQALLHSIELAVRGDKWTVAHEQSKQLQRVLFKLYMMTDTGN